MGRDENRVTDIEIRMAALAAAAAGCSGSETGRNAKYVLRVAKQYEDYLRTGNCE
jgi:hypothetical protein